MLPVSPLTIIVLVVLMGGLGVGASLLVYQRIQNRHAHAFFFDRQGGVSLRRGNSFSGLVSFDDGGYVERQDARIDMKYGRPVFETGDPGWRRKRRPVFLLKARDSAPMQISPDGTVSVTNLTEAEHKERLALAAEIASRDAARKVARGDLVGVMLGGAVILVALGLTAIVGVVAARGLLDG